jgi:3-oxoacyl-[acyl-carrier-protein] synthase II
MDQVVVVGMGMIDTLGNSVSECFENLISEEYREPSPFDTKHEHMQHLKAFYAQRTDLNHPEYIRKPLYNSLSYASKMALHAIEEATEHLDLDVKTTACVYTSLASKPGLDTEFFQDHMVPGKRMSPRKAVQVLKDFTVGFICNVYGYEGAACAMDAACATGLYSIDYGMHLLRSHDVVIVGGADTPVSNDDMFYFNGLGALGTHSAPFDKNRDGFLMGEGAGAIVLTTETYAIKKGWPVYAILGPVHHGNDGWNGNATAPDPNATGSTRAMKGVYGPSVEDEIAFVNAHGTSTPLGDDLEYQTIQKVIGDVPVVSFKSQVGHTLAASAINETIYTIQSLRNKVIPANKNITDCDLENIHINNLETDKSYAIKNAFGFGGKSSSLLVGVENDN